MRFLINILNSDDVTHLRFLEHAEEATIYRITR